MGCFCKQAILTMQSACQLTVSAGAALHGGIGVELSAQAGVGLTAGLEATVVTPTSPRLAAAAAWLAARWLPAEPWQPDPAWLEIDLPDLPMPAGHLAVMLALVQVRQDCQRDLGINLTVSAQAAKVARIIATLNRRTPDLALQLNTSPPWEALALQLDHAERVTLAARAGLFLPLPVEIVPVPPIAVWQPLLLKIKALAPLIAIGQTPGLNLQLEGMPGLLAAMLREMLAISIPPLDDLTTILRIIARFDAIARLQLGLGLNPCSVAFSQVKAAVDLRTAAAVALLPPGEFPAHPPNPGLLITADMIAAARAIPRAVLAQLHWNVPRYDQLALLTTLVPVVKLVGLLRSCGIEAVCQSPCDAHCDARASAALPRA